MIAHILLSAAASYLICSTIGCINSGYAASLPQDSKVASANAVEEPSFMTKMVAHMFELFNLKQVVQDIKISKTTEGTCQSCKFGIGLLQHLIQFGRGREDLGRLAHTICVSLRIETPRVCTGIVQVFKVPSPPSLFLCSLLSCLLCASRLTRLAAAVSCARLLSSPSIIQTAFRSFD